METTANTVGPYKITSLLGKSASSAVYRAVHTQNQTEVVIRFLIPKSKLNDAVLRRFEQSAASLKNLQHPNLVSICDSGVHRGAPYIVSAYHAGETLRQKLGLALPWAQAARLLTPAAKALAYLHAHHIPHRNVNSDNILLGKSFLLADTGVQQLGELIGSVPAAPNQDWNRQDIQALGQVFYEMLTGKSAAAVTIKDIPPELPETVQSVLRRCLPGSGQPYETMQVFEQALETLGWGAAGKPEGHRPAARAGASQPQKKTVRESRRKKQRSGVWLIPAVLLVFGAVIAGVLILNHLRVDNESADLPKAAQTEMLSSQPAEQPTAELAAAVETAPTQALPQPSSTPEPTPAPSIGSVLVSPVDGMTMVYVPAGEFLMGSDDRDENEKPMHGVYLNAYWIDQTEVTNAQFALCVQAGACEPPLSSSSTSRPQYYGSPDFGDYPVIFVDWGQASNYCAWAGRRLPSEAEWEKASRGVDGAICPWGNTSPAPDRLNYNGMLGDTTRVGSYPAGASPYGALDMAGNVWEWVSDWYSSSAYQLGVYENPTGPADGTRRVLRGGSWYYELNKIRSAFRFSASDNTILSDVGFRCALPAQ